MADSAPVVQYVPKVLASRPGRAPPAASGKSKKRTEPVKRPDPMQLANLLKMFSKGR